MASKKLNADIRSLAALVFVAVLAACHESGKVEQTAARPAQFVEQTGKSAIPAGEKEAKQVVLDMFIATKVKTALIHDPQANGFQITVNSYRGLVQISGFVDTLGQKKHAGKLAGRVEGVQEVRNDLIVTVGTDFTPPVAGKAGGVVRF